jgi:galactose-1-phosphate uridylyltransferase
MSYSRFYNQMPDGTTKQLNPFTGTEVWSVPGRGNKPITNEIPKTAKKLELHKPEDYCSFCEKNYFETPPEKERIILENGEYKKLKYITAEEYFNTKAEFRRVPNLFEIVTLDYWRKNYEFKLNAEKLEWKNKYLSTPKGKEHIINIVNTKLKLSGKSQEELDKTSEDEKINYSDSFFGGGHELVISKHHYKNGAEWDADRKSSGELTPEEHYRYIDFTIDAKEDIYLSNRYVRYVSVFQNWLRPAGASFDHLHKQLVALDEWGNTISDQTEMIRKDPNVFNAYGANLAAMLNLIIAENDYAIAYAGIGHRYPTIEIFSKSNNSRPSSHTDEEVRGMSDLVHACHAATGNQISCNEEWYYTPIDSIYKMPWHILIKWRINVPAGFEGGTKIFINPVSPIDLRDKVVPRLYKLRDEKLIANFMIAEECNIKHNPLKYYLS